MFFKNKNTLNHSNYQAYYTGNFYPKSYYNENCNPNEYNYMNNYSQQQMQMESSEQQQGEKFLQNGKYTCKFYVQIENDNEFQVARRLIGSKGCNMKKNC